MSSVLVEKRATGVIPKGLLWVDGVRCVSGGQIQLDALCRRGKKNELAQFPFTNALKVPLVDERAHFYHQLDTDMVLLQDQQLANCETCVDPSDLLVPLSHGIRPTKRHHIYRFDGDPPVWIPALLLIRALFVTSAATERVLLCPNGVDFLGKAQLVDGEAEIIPGPLYRNPRGHAALPRLIAWTQLCGDARRSHASILKAMSVGELALELPQARLTCWVRGLRTKGGLLATEINAVDVQFPIPAKKIVLNTKSGSLSWPTYEPRKKSALSSSFRPATMEPSLSG